MLNLKVVGGDEDDRVDLDLSDCLVCGDALRLQLNSGKWPKPLLCFHTWPAPPCFHTWPTLRWNTLRDTTSILTCDLFYPHWPALCFIIFHSTALCQIQIYVYSAELHCTVLWDITCTQWYNALDGTSMLVLHCVDCRRQPKAVITHTRVSVPQLLIRMSMNYELWTMSMNYGLWSWVLSMSMSFER